MINAITNASDRQRDDILSLFALPPDVPEKTTTSQDPSLAVERQLNTMFQGRQDARCLMGITSVTLRNNRLQ